MAAMEIFSHLKPCLIKSTRVLELVLSEENATIVNEPVSTTLEELIFNRLMPTNI